MARPAGVPGPVSKFGLSDTGYQISHVTVVVGSHVGSLVWPNTAHSRLRLAATHGLTRREERMSSGERGAVRVCACVRVCARMCAPDAHASVVGLAHAAATPPGAPLLTRTRALVMQNIVGRFARTQSLKISRFALGPKNVHQPWPLALNPFFLVP